VTFYAENEQNKAQSAWLRLPAELGHCLLFALGYEPRDMAFFRELPPREILIRIHSVRRQFAIGRGREFTCSGVNERQLLGELAELEKVARHAREGSSIVLLWDV
jgi:hypothetical protein